ncbi:hypothetical protein ACFTAO_39485 [Paenibacillus rhizoplanae]
MWVNDYRVMGGYALKASARGGSSRRDCGAATGGGFAGGGAEVERDCAVGWELRRAGLRELWTSGRC